MRPVLLLALLLPWPAAAQGEDAAHRADRLETRRLNTRSWNGYAGGRRADAAPADGDGAYARAQAEYRDRLDAWRRRVAACEAGRYDACQ